jgi:hypothetical protein
MTNRQTPPIPFDLQRDIGGAVVRQKFSSGGRDYQNGDVLTEAEVRAIKPANFRALLSIGKLQVYPKPRSGPQADPMIPKVVSVGKPVPRNVGPVAVTES